MLPTLVKICRFWPHPLDTGAVTINIMHYFKYYLFPSYCCVYSTFQQHDVKNKDTFQ